MSDFFTRSTFTDRNQEKDHRCIFEQLSPCSDHVSRYVCNGHAVSIFELLYQYVHTTTGNNDVNYRIVTYITSPWNWCLPLFQNPDNGVVSCDELYAFANNVSSRTNGKINATKLSDILSNLMNLNAYVDHCSPRTWIDENPNNCVLMTDEVGSKKIRFLYELPPLHRYLLAYIDNSQVIDSAEKIVRIDTMSLVRTNASTSPSFMLINKPRLLKYSTHKHCVATPVVLTSIRFLSVHDTQITYNKTTAFSNYTC